MSYPARIRVDDRFDEEFLRKLVSIFEFSEGQLENILQDLDVLRKQAQVAPTTADGTTADNIMAIDSSGQLKDTGQASSDLHSRDHDIDSTSDHNGVSGATEDNLISFDANGLPKDSGIAAGTVASSSVTVVTNLQITSDNKLQKKTQALTITSGLITAVGAESGWTDVGQLTIATT